MGTETLAVSATELALSISDKIETCFSKGDKFPSFDGEIAYKPYGTKEDLCLTRVQIKGRSVPDASILSDETTSFSFQVEDLKNYRDNGGVLLFVVNRCGRDHAVYVRSLTPILARRLIREAGNHKTITVKLSRIPEEVSLVDELVINHVENSRMQASFANANLPTLDLAHSTIGQRLHIQYTSIASNEYEAISHLIGKELCQYLIEPNMPVPIPTETTGSVSKAERDQQLMVSVGEEVFFEAVHVVVDATGTQFWFGSSIVVAFDSGTLEPQVITLRLCGSLNDRMTALRFMYKAATAGGFEINGVFLKLGDDATTQSLDQHGYHDALEFFEKLTQLLDVLHDDDEVNLDVLSDEDVKWVGRLYAALVEGKLVKCELVKEDTVCLPVRILERTYLIIHHRVQDEYFQLIDLAAYDGEIRLQYEDGNRDYISKYGAISPVNCLKARNVDVQNVIESIKAVGHNSPNDGFANDFALALLTRYDERGAASDIGDARDLLEWVLNCPDEPEVVNSRLNLLQIKYRYGELNEDDLDELRTLAKNDTSLPPSRQVVSVAALALLGSKKAKSAYKRLSKECREQLDHFPIGNVLNGRARKI